MQAVDPATDWWAFAHFMQKWHDRRVEAKKARKAEKATPAAQ